MWQQVARLHKPSVPGWLTDIVPAWLVAAVQPKRAPVPWPEMLRAGIAICVPMAAGIAAGQRVLGLLIAVGGLLGIVVDNGGAYVTRVRRVGSAAAGGAVGITIGSLIHGHGWIAVLALVLVAGTSALLSAISDIGSVTGLQLLVYSAFGLGPIGALRPWWHTALGFVLGVAWALLLTMPSWLLSPRSAEQRSVAGVYRALGGSMRAIGTADTAAVRKATAAMSAAYDTVLAFRATAGGRNQRMTRLMGMLTQGNLIAEAVTALWMEGRRPPPEVIDAMDRIADAIEAGRRLPDTPPVPGTSPGMVALREALAGLAAMRSGNWTPPDAVSPPKPPLSERIGVLSDRLSAKLTLLFALRLMACIGVAGVLSEVLPLQRSYWVVLTVAIVLKPDFGSVFARAVQRGIGTVVGAVLGAVIIILVPYGPWLLVPFGVLAALLPYGRSRNFGLQAVFLTPLVVVLIDLLVPGGWQLAEDRLLDTLLGCAVALLVGYAPWPTSWQAHLPGQFAGTIKDVCRYMEAALVTPWAESPGGATPAASDGASPDGASLHGASADGASPDAAVTELPSWAPSRRRARRSISDTRTEFERTMSEPRAVSRRATAWWPALVALEGVVNAVTGAAVAISHGAPAPAPGAVRQLESALDAIADAVLAGVAPSGTMELPSDEPLQQVTEAVRAMLSVMVSQQTSAAPGDQPEAHAEEGQPTGR
jgi:uncharacterized membrane protein YccC